MATEQQNPFELQPWGGMPQITPQQGAQQGELPQSGFGGLPPGVEGSYFQLSPEAMQMMWAPQTQLPLPQPQPQINPLV